MQTSVVGAGVSTSAGYTLPVGVSLVSAKQAEPGIVCDDVDGAGVRGAHDRVVQHQLHRRERVPLHDIDPESARSRTNFRGFLALPSASADRHAAYLQEEYHPSLNCETIAEMTMQCLSCVCRESLESENSIVMSMNLNRGVTG